MGEDAFVILEELSATPNPGDPYDGRGERTSGSYSLTFRPLGMPTHKSKQMYLKKKKNIDCFFKTCVHIGLASNLWQQFFPSARVISMCYHGKLQTALEPTKMLIVSNSNENFIYADPSILFSP